MRTIQSRNSRFPGGRALLATLLALPALTTCVPASRYSKVVQQRREHQAASKECQAVREAQRRELIALRVDHDRLLRRCVADLKPTNQEIALLSRLRVERTRRKEIQAALAARLRRQVEQKSLSIIDLEPYVLLRLAPGVVSLEAPERGGSGLPNSSLADIARALAEHTDRHVSVRVRVPLSHQPVGSDEEPWDQSATLAARLARQLVELGLPAERVGAVGQGAMAVGDAAAVQSGLAAAPLIELALRPVH